MPRPSNVKRDQLPALNQFVLDRKLNISDQVYEHLRRAILRIEIPPGTILSEVEITQASGASRTPVREALKRLELENLIETYPNIGTLVTKLNIRTVRESVIMRSLLEADAAERVANLRSDQVVAGLEAIIAKQAAADADGDIDTVYACDESFHKFMFDALGFDRMWSCVRIARTEMQRFRSLATQSSQNRKVALRFHRSIIEAIRSGDGQRARRLMNDHVLSNLDFWEGIKEMHRDYIEIED